MKKLFLLSFSFAVLLLLSSNVSAQTAYWTETWDDTASTAPPTSSPGPLTPTKYTISPSGEWTFYAVYRGGSSNSCSGGANARTLRMPKISTVQGAGALPPGYAMTPKLASGVSKVTFKEGRGGTSRIISVYKSTDDGATWTLVGKTENGTTKCADVTFDVNDSKVNRLKFSNEVDNGDVDLEDVSVYPATGTSVETDEVIPTDYVLNQNYPNPFNPSTTISFAIPKEGMVQLKIYDQLGREVASLVNDFLQAGSHRFVWDTANSSSPLTSGVYFAELRAGNFVKSIKVLLMK